MLYDIALRISHAYDRPANAGRHLLRLMPRAIPNEQDVVWALLDLKPEAEERVDRVDFFANPTTEIAYRSAHDKVAFALKCRIDRHVGERSTATSPSVQQLPSEIAAYTALDANAPHHFLGHSPRIAPSPEIGAYARALVGPTTPVTDAVRLVGQQLHRDMRFDAEATTVDTSPEEAFAGRHGVCQDFAHVMIAGLREIGVPAGYVSGFLRTIPPPGKPRLQGADAMHAWVRAWCGAEVGWVEFDPTNNLDVANDHIVVARGRDYSDVAPVKGVLRTSGAQSSQQSVDVVPV